MNRMRRSSVVAVALSLASLGSLALTTRLYLWPGAPAPWLLAAPEPPPATEPRPAFPTTTRGVDVKPGDSLVSALARAGVDSRTAGEITARLGRQGAELRKLRPGAALEVIWNFRREPIEVRYAPSPWIRFAAAPANGSWAVTRSQIEPEVRVEAVQGRVRRSLFEAVEETGESPQLVVAMVEIFSSDFDFTADTRSGDQFRLLVEKRYARGVFVDYGRILATQYASGGRTLSGVGYARSGEARWAYYDPSGRSLRKSFLKSPLEFTRITSGFTYARPHPILGGVRPHLAIDYAAPAGTPVRAVADGVVTAAGWDGGNGISVTIHHRSGYATMYNHLSTLGAGLRPGARVSQRQVIGYVGATGLATGPHLDYRVSKHGQFVNPLGERFIPGEPIATGERTAFVDHARALIRRLEDATPF